MKVTRFVATEEGESRFTEFEIPLLSRQILDVKLLASNGFASPSVSLVEVQEGAQQGWHGATARRIAIVLSGVFEIETGNGEKRQWCAGEVFIADDEKGRHATRVVEGPVRLVFIPFPSDFVIDKWSEGGE
jgi:quercetin dioxygenase-like cupin family protein